FGYYSGNTLDSHTTNEDTGLAYTNRLVRAGVDLKIAWEQPIYFDVFGQFLWGRDSNATGLGEEAKWRGGFVQLDLKPSEDFVLYGRYDWIDGDKYDDTDVTLNG